MKRAIPVLLLLALTACSAASADPVPCGTETPTPTPSVTPTPTPTEEPAAKKLIGMSAPASLWSQRLAEVGAQGVTARRIFADLTSTGRDQSDLIGQAIAAGMLPIISYKEPNGDAAGVASGKYDAWLTAAGTYLASLGVPVVAAFHHEPNGDMAASMFRAASQRFLDRVQSPSVAVGPILNGWLLDRQTATFASFTSPALLAEWDYLAVDSYQSGTQQNPGAPAGRAVPLLAKWLDGQGFPDMPIGVGEWNAASASDVRAAGETLLGTPEVAWALVWNNAASRFGTLTGDEITAFKAIKSDPRAQQ